MLVALTLTLGAAPVLPPSELPAAIRARLDELDTCDEACRAAVEADCVAGDAVACGALNRRLAKEPQHVKRVAELLRELCRDSGQLCYDAAMYSSLPTDTRRALLDRGCEAGDLVVCDAAAEAWLSDEDPSPSAALADLDRACVGKVRGMCFSAAETRIVFGGPEEQRAGEAALDQLAGEGDRDALWALIHLRWGGPAGWPDAIADEIAACPREGHFLIPELPAECAAVLAALRAPPRRRGR